MIRFSAFLVVVAVGTLVAGVVTSKLLLVYIAIGVSGLALLALGAGAAVHWRELTGKPETAAAGTPAAAGASAQAPVSSPPPAVVPPQVATPEPATAASRPAWSGAVPAGSSRPGYLPPEPPPVTRPTPVSEWKWRDDPAPREAAAGKPAASLTGQPDSRPAAAEDQPPARDDDLSVQDQTMIFRQPDQTMIFRAQPPAAEEAAPPSGDGDGDGEPAADASAPAGAATAGGAATEDNAATADDSATAGDSSSKADAEPAADAPPSADAAPSADASPPDAAAPDDEPEPADDATTIAKAVAPGAAPASDLEVTVVPGVPRYHKANCILIRFMGDSDLDTMTVAAAREAGCTPCRACLPDQSEESPELSGAPEPEPQA